MRDTHEWANEIVLGTAEQIDDTLHRFVNCDILKQRIATALNLAYSEGLSAYLEQEAKQGVKKLGITS